MDLANLHRGRAFLTLATTNPCQILSAANIFTSNATGGSQFWCNIHKIKSFVKLGAKFRLGSGEKVLFWEDYWTGESPLCTRFPRLYEISAKQDILVSQAYSGDRSHLQFRRTFWEEEVLQWEQLIQEIDVLSLSSEADQISWTLEPNGLFTVHSLYQKVLHVSDRGVPKFFWSARGKYQGERQG